MRKIFWRVLIYYGVVLILFSALIGLMFTRFNRTNIIGTYQEQLSSLIKGVASRTSQAVLNQEKETFYSYLSAMENFGMMQEIDIWVVSNTNGETPMDEIYTNVDIETVQMPAETRQILEAAYNGKTRKYTDYDEIYHAEMLHMAVPIRDESANVIGAVLASGPMEIQENTIVQYEKYMLVCVVVGLFVAAIVAMFLSGQLVRPIVKIKEAALVMAAGKYDYKTGVERRDELGLLAESMDILSERLVEAEEFRENQEKNRRDFFSNVSHELRTPITVVKGYADTLADEYVKDPEKQAEYIERIRRECTSMERLVSDLLILSRMQNPDYEMNMEVLNVIAVAQDAMRSLRILMQEVNLTGEVTFDDACSLIEGDYDRIRQLFVILLQNAVKYADEGTEIHVHISRANGIITTTVTDFGIVIPEEEWNTIFEKFYRASTHGTKDGSGLGLVVASNIVVRHGGTIRVRSTEKEGTCFTIEFPETSEKIS